LGFAQASIHPIQSSASALQRTFRARSTEFGRATALTHSSRAEGDFEFNAGLFGFRASEQASSVFGGKLGEFLVNCRTHSTEDGRTSTAHVLKVLLARKLDELFGFRASIETSNAFGRKLRAFLVNYRATGELSVPIRRSTAVPPR
jgi:hypothetical protein